MESSSEEGEEGAMEEAELAALTEAEAAAASKVPVPQVLRLWAQNEARLDAEEWLPQRLPDAGVYRMVTLSHYVTGLRYSIGRACP